MDSNNNMCLFDVKQCKKVGISTEEDGVSTDTPKAQNPSDVSTPPRRRRPKMQVRRKEVDSNTNVVPLTLDLDEATPIVAIVKIGSAKTTRSWIQTPTKLFVRFRICVLQFVYYSDLSVARFMMHASFFDIGTS